MKMSLMVEFWMFLLIRCCHNNLHQFTANLSLCTKGKYLLVYINLEMYADVHTLTEQTTKKKKNMQNYDFPTCDLQNKSHLENWGKN